jgi:hypothetical protein
VGKRVVAMVREEAPAPYTVRMAKKLLLLAVVVALVAFGVKKSKG